MSGRYTYTSLPHQPPPPYSQQSYSPYVAPSHSWSYQSVHPPTTPNSQHAYSPYVGSPYSSSSYQPLHQPSPNPSSYFHPMSTNDAPYSSKQFAKQHRRRCIDYPTSLALVSVWAFLTLSSVVLVYFCRVATSEESDEGDSVSQTEIAGTIALSSGPILLATILNEVLVDRCWRRVVYSALGSNAQNLSNETLARNLRAANFGWVDCVKRLFKGELSRQDFRTLASYGLLRWGTAISIASIQLCVSWEPAQSGIDTGLYTASRRYIWLVGPAFLHACSVFGTMALWLMPPWRFFSDRFQDHGLLRKYEPYLKRVPGGSAAKYEAVAQYLLDPNGTKHRSLEKKNTPGIQFFAKLKGIWLGLLFMNFPPAAAYAYFRFTDHNDILRFGVYRFTLHLVFLAQNIFYLLALDFAVWNMSLEGFCKRTTGKPNKSLRHLGYSSGIMLFFKACRQRRPVRAAIFLWLFWLQACLMRFLTVLYILCVQVLSYGTIDDRDDFYDPQFWLSWTIMTAVFAVPLFLIWLFTEFQAPICEQDGWRWAKIAQHALREDGFYGVRNNEAVWAMDVAPFDSCKGEKLL